MQTNKPMAPIVQSTSMEQEKVSRSIAFQTFEGISLILPAFNEGDCLFGVGSDIIQYCENLHAFRYELIIVNDGSSDDTVCVAEKLQKKYPNQVVVLTNDRNRGYGFSIKRGINHSRYDLVFFTDADGQFDIQNLNLLIPLMISGVPDIVVGYRKERQDPWLRLFLSGCYNVLVRILFDISVKDVDCAFKIFRKRVFDKIEIHSKNFFINTEVIAKAVFFGFRILEIGVDHFPRTAGSSTVRFRHVPLTFKELARIWLEMKRLEKQFPKASRFELNKSVPADHLHGFLDRKF